MNWIKIGENIFEIKDISVQLSLMKHATIYLEIDIAKFPTHYDYFIDKYENRKIFDIHSSKFMAQGCRIKTIDIEFKSKLNLNIICDILDPDISERRDHLIEEILKDIENFNE
jgi:hypothetical protein